MKKKNNRVAHIMLASLAALAVSGCGNDAASDAQSETTEVFSDAPDMDIFQIEGMTAEEIGDFELAGEMRCYFAATPADDPLLLVAADFEGSDVEPQVLVKYAGRVEEGSVREETDIEAIARGGTFDTSAFTIDIARSEEDEERSDFPGAYAAFMRVRQAGGEPAISQGVWTCGL